MPDWIAFYTVTATASAALLGLLFVAVSIGASGAMAEPRSTIRNLAEQAFQNYLLILVLSCVALFPATSAQAIGTAIFSVTASRALWAVVRLGSILDHVRKRHAARDALRRQAVSLFGIGCLLFASARIAWAGGQDFHLLASGTLILLASSAVASWALLLELMQGRTGEAKHG